MQLLDSNRKTFETIRLWLIARLKLFYNFVHLEDFTYLGIIIILSTDYVMNMLFQTKGFKFKWHTRTKQSTIHRYQHLYSTCPRAQGACLGDQLLSWANKYPRPCYCPSLSVLLGETPFLGTISSFALKYSTIDVSD